MNDKQVIISKFIVTFGEASVCFDLNLLILQSKYIAFLELSPF